MIDESDPEALRVLQEDIYRQRVLEARKMTTSERLDRVFQLSQLGFDTMLADMRSRKPALTEEEAWCEVAAQISRERQIEEVGFFTTVDPSRAAK